MNLASLVKVILAILFVFCLASMPYGYFQFVRLAGCVGFAYLAYDAHVRARPNNVEVILWIGSALLINPIIKVALGRTLWNIVDVIWAALLLFSIAYQYWRNRYR